MEYLTTKILYYHPNWKHVALLHSKRQLAVLILLFIELNLIEASTESRLLEWSEGTRFQLGWGYRILVVKYSIER